MLRYQLNPHFLFNTLNAINAHVRLGENVQASEMIQFLSRFLRHSLEQDSTEEVPLEQELESLRLYLKIEQARFGERLDISYDIAEGASEALVPSLVLQPIVENAMKYAVAPSETGCTVEIRAEQQGTQLQLQVLDTGPGMDDSAALERRGIGLSNTLERLGALYGENYEFTVGNRSPKGLAVTIRLPWLEAVPVRQAGGMH